MGGAVFLWRYFEILSASQLVRLTVDKADCIFTDTLLSALPCFFLWHVQMKRRLKLAVGLLLSLGMTYVSSDEIVKGLLTCRRTAICAAVRVGYLKAALMNKNASGSSKSNHDWYNISDHY